MFAKQAATPPDAVAVACTGSLWQAGAVLLTPFAARMREVLLDGRVVRASGDALQGTATLAGNGNTALEPLVVRKPDAAPIGESTRRPAESPFARSVEQRS